MTSVPDTAVLDDLLSVAEEAARAAAAELTSRAGDLAALRIDTKSTATDPVSEADLAAEEAIRAVLARRVPDDGIVGEEGDDVIGSTGRRWIVDPLDGTVNYLYGNPQWCVSVACEGLVGVVYDPGREELWAGAADGRATLNGAPLPAASAPDGGLAHALVESCLRHDVGVSVSLPGDPFVELFSESAGRVVVTVAAADSEELTALAGRHGVPLQRLGATGGSELVVEGQFSIPLPELREVWTRTLPAALA
jgi:hypothetical protein